MHTRPTSRFATALICLLATYSAHADEREIDEIVVTADFRERPAQSLPASVTVLGAAAIEDAAVQHFEELINAVPNLNWSGDGHRARYFQIRGIGEIEQYEGAPNPSIGFLIDDIDLSGIGSVATLFDMQSIEVLRGPQGSRYGANALGGLIYLRSTAPSAERDGRVQVTVGDDDAISIGAAVNGALNKTRTTTFRFSAQKHESDGFRSNSYLNREDTNGRDEATMRVRLAFQPSASLAANLSLIYNKIDNGYDAFALDNSNTVLSDKPGKDAQDTKGASIRFDWSANKALILTSITALADSDIEFSFDADWGNDDSWAPFTYDFISARERQRKTISQEFRLISESWLVGFYLLNLQEDLLALDQGDYIDPFTSFSDSTNSLLRSDFESLNVAAFGQVDRDLSVRTRLALGLRLEHRSTDYSDTLGLQTEPSESLWGGEVSLSHEHDEDLTSYVSLSKGYKAGGFNLGPVPVGRREFGAEELWTIEAGLKASLLENSLHMNLAVFHGRHRDQQVRTSTQLVAGDPASFVFFTANAAKETTSEGVEAEIRWIPGESWEFYANAGLLNTSLDTGRDQAHAPRYTLAGGIVYRHPRGFYGRVDSTARDEFYFDTSHDQKSKAYGLVNARLGYESESWLLSLWGRNIFDKQYAVRGFFFGNEPPNFPNTLYTRSGDARQVGVTIEKRF